MSMMVMSRPSTSKAPFTAGANSVSVINTRASPWFRQNASAGPSRRVFSVFTTAPIIAGPKAHSYISGVLEAITATVSP